ncbi:putative cytochrome P450 [Stachybotrys elegans]|uniref:Cytochrome P450 n=1 Tax=Stachybotrys elegans TaxID=80388 RepID=A0A8K0WR07_9HYPO|nr:putative cytochrome P450 [Stachybotrys elegans]
MLSYAGLIGYIIGLYIVARVVSSRLRARRLKRKAEQWGCSSAPSPYPNGIKGYALLRESIAANRADRGPQFIVERMDRISKDCHTVHLPILDYEIYVTRDPENIKALFTSQDFDISGTRQLSWLPLLGKGIFTSRGQIWKHSRAMLRPLFAKEQISNVDVDEEHLQILLKQFPVDGKTGWTDKVDLGPLFFKFTLDVITDFVYGHSTHSLMADSPHQNICRSFDAAKMWIDRRGALAKFYWLLNTKDFRVHCKILHEFVDKIVTDTLDNKSTKSNDPEKQGRFTLLHELTKECQDPVFLRNQTLQILVAGRDTSGSLLGWCIFWLARNPEVYQKLRKIILDIFDDRMPDFQTLNTCTYLQYFLSEVLRISAVIPLDERVAMCDTTLPTGGGPQGKDPVFLPKGTQVLMPIYAVMHRQDLWETDPDRFDPERWGRERPGWQFTPFAAGPRKCLGQQFAKALAAYVLARFCQLFDKIENMEEGDGELKLHHAIENRSGMGVQVRLHSAKF